MKYCLFGGLDQMVLVLRILKRKCILMTCCSLWFYVEHVDIVLKA
jgi:hypothetical protein